MRPLLHTGRAVNVDLADDATALYGSVARDGSRALFTWVRFQTSAAGQSGRVRFPGLDRTARYRVTVREELGAASRHQGRDPEWVARAAEHPIELSGAVLAGAGVPMPTLNPQQAMLIDIERIS
ncbi:GH36 C-terminal domain-containing protein [Micromonospora sp. LZ34]